jgi:pantetheine-phosphate adenylyltransferase
VTVALYAGSFDPPTLGHLDIIARAAKVSSKLMIGVGVNPHKKAFLPAETRMELLRAECRGMGLDNTEVVAFEGATVRFAKERGINTLVRGLRGSGDLDRERGLAEINRTNGFDTLYLLSRSSHSHISASLVREVIAAGLSLDELVSTRVAAALVQSGAIQPRAVATSTPVSRR